MYGVNAVSCVYDVNAVSRMYCVNAVSCTTMSGARMGCLRLFSRRKTRASVQQKKDQSEFECRRVFSPLSRCLAFPFPFTTVTRGSWNEERVYTWQMYLICQNRSGGFFLECGERAQASRLVFWLFDNHGLAPVTVSVTTVPGHAYNHGARCCLSPITYFLPP